LFITKVDQAFHVKCFFEEASRGLTAELGVSMIPTTELEARHGIPGCTYSIHKSSIEELDEGRPAGPPIQFARVGDRVLHQWHCNDKMFGVLINNCYVTDGFGKKADVIDDKGPISPSPYGTTPPLDYDLQTEAMTIFGPAFPTSEESERREGTKVTTTSVTQVFETEEDLHEKTPKKTTKPGKRTNSQSSTSPSSACAISRSGLFAVAGGLGAVCAALFIAVLSMFIKLSRVEGLHFCKTAHTHTLIQSPQENWWDTGHPFSFENVHRRVLPQIWNIRGLPVTTADTMSASGYVKGQITRATNALKEKLTAAEQTMIEFYNVKDSKEDLEKDSKTVTACKRQMLDIVVGLNQWMDNLRSAWQRGENYIKELDEKARFDVLQEFMDHWEASRAEQLIANAKVLSLVISDLAIMVSRDSSPQKGSPHAHRGWARRRRVRVRSTSPTQYGPTQQLRPASTPPSPQPPDNFSSSHSSPFVEPELESSWAEQMTAETAKESTQCTVDISKDNKKKEKKDEAEIASGLAALSVGKDADKEQTTEEAMDTTDVAQEDQPSIHGADPDKQGPAIENGQEHHSHSTSRDAIVKAATSTNKNNETKEEVLERRKKRMEAVTTFLNEFTRQNEASDPPGPLKTNPAPTLFMRRPEVTPFSTLNVEPYTVEELTARQFRTVYDYITKNNLLRDRVRNIQIPDKESTPTRPSDYEAVAKVSPRHGVWAVLHSAMQSMAPYDRMTKGSIPHMGSQEKQVIKSLSSYTSTSQSNCGEEEMLKNSCNRKLVKHKHRQ
ncbi:hypothetical protein TELCIR_12418, partial [Teladorsagia circumcincta]